MKVWLYYRLSRDEDEELNSLNNQRKIIYSFAVSNGHEVVGESFDDNVSGMHFNREGIDKIYEVVEAGKIEAIIVKDLSRLGRHRTQTALFIDYLREHDVRVLSATENIDTFNENDDLIIGFKGLVNDFYARDGSRRVRTGYRQKQKEGIVTIPPFGYFKDKNTKKVVVVEDLISTGGSSLKAVEAIRNNGCEVSGMVAAYTYGFDVAAQAFKAANVKLITLTNYEAVVAEAVRIGYIDPSDVEVLNEWRKDPAHWNG